MSSFTKEKSKIIALILIQFYIVGLVIPFLSQPIQTSITYTQMQWSTPKRISIPAKNCYQPSILVNDSDFVYVAWPGSIGDYEYNTFVNFCYLPVNSSSWSEIQDVSHATGFQGTAQICSIIQDRKNYTHLCWLTSLGELYYRYFNGIS